MAERPNGRLDIGDFIMRADGTGVCTDDSGKLRDVVLGKEGGTG